MQNFSFYGAGLAEFGILSCSWGMFSGLGNVLPSTFSLSEQDSGGVLMDCGGPALQNASRICSGRGLLRFLPMCID